MERKSISFPRILIHYTADVTPPYQFLWFYDIILNSSNPENLERVLFIASGRLEVDVICKLYVNKIHVHFSQCIRGTLYSNIILDKKFGIS